MNREQLLTSLLDEIKDGLIVCSLGKMSRELFELRKQRGEPNDDFYMMGSMGCAIAIGLGVALNTKKKVYVLTGDGAFLMKLGSMATYLKYQPKNMRVIIINNDCHESTGGQETNFEMIRDSIPSPIAIRDVETGTRLDLGRPDISPKQIADNFYGKVCSEQK